MDSDEAADVDEEEEEDDDEEAGKSWEELEEEALRCALCQKSPNQLQAWCHW